MGIAFFDMDNTLTSETSAAVFLGKAIGKEDECKKLEEQIVAKQITDEQWYRRIGELVRGYSPAQLRAVYKRMPLIDGIPETIGLLNEMNFKTAIVTIGVGEFAKFLSEDYGFDYYFGCSTIIKNGLVEGFGQPFLTSKDKVECVNRLCAELGMDPNECIAVGDSYSDLHMFGAVGTSIAINHSTALEGHATYYIKPCTNLAEIVSLLH